MNSKCPMTTRQIIDEYFIENRARLLDIAAYLDRLDRSADAGDARNDFRMHAFFEALEQLARREPGRAKRVHLVFSDPTTDPREHLDRKAAYGAYNPALEVR